MILFRALWLVLPLLLIACGGSSSNKDFPIDRCTTDCVTGKERLQIEPAQAALVPGAAQQLQVVLWNDDEVVREVTDEVVWQSVDPTIASVNAQGKVVGQASGNTRISAKLGAIEASIPVQVLDVAIVGLSVIPASQISTPGLRHQYQALALLSSGLRVDVTERASWSVSQPSVASVSALGVVTALALGDTEVRVRWQSFETSAHLQVVTANQAELKITPASLSTPAGTKVLFSASLLLGEQEIDVSKQVQWQSTNSAIAEFNTPSNYGLVSAKAPGGVVINASLSYEGRSLAAAAQLNVTEAQITSLRVTPASLNMPVGTTGGLTAIAEYADGNSKDVTFSADWSSANPAIATVAALTRQTGMVTAISPGSTNITAQFAGFSDSAVVTVTSASLLSLSLQPQSAVVVADVQLRYQLFAHFSDGTKCDVTSAAVFSSSEPDVAVIQSGGDRAGLATAISAGSTSILASYQNQQLSAPLTVLTESVTPESLSLTPIQSELLVGSKLQYRALLTLSNGHQQDVTASVSWGSSDANIATLDGQGLASAVSVGSASISAYLPLRCTAALTASVSLQVVESEIVALHLQPVSKLSVPGLEHQYTALAELASGALSDVSDQVSWSVSNSSIAAIDANGLLKTLAAGRATITATMGAHSASGVLQVIDGDTVSLAITPASANTPVGTELQFTAQLRVGTQTLDVTDQVIWRSGAPQVADFVQTAEPGLISALAQGSGVIGANFTYKGATIGATADLTVSAATVTGLRVSPTSLSLPAGTSGLINAIASFSDGSERNVTAAARWQVVNPAVAAVRLRSQQANNIQALTAGSTNITAEFAGFSASANVSVSAAALLGLSLSPQDAAISTGVQIHYQLLARYSDGAEEDVTADALFSSSDESVAIVESAGESAGLATALAAGNGQIQASYGGLAATGNLTVVAEVITPQTLSITPVAAELLIGSQLQYRAVVTLSNGYQQDVTRSVLWLSGDSSIATINSDGLALGVGAGSATISAQLSGLRSDTLAASANLMVKAAPVTVTDFYVEPAQSTTLPGASVQYRAWAITSEGARHEVTDSASWQSSDPKLAGISGKGKVRALAVGSVQIQAGFNYMGQTFSDAASLTIIAPALTALSITPASAEILLGQQLAFVATAQLEVGVSVDVTDMVSWSSSDPAIASINAVGLATSIAGGTTGIEATLTYQGSVYSASASLQVDDPTPELTALTVSPQQSAVLAGHQLSYQCQAVFSDGSIHDVSSSCQWSTTAADIAVIDALTGELTGVAAGITEVSASFAYMGVSAAASTLVTVVPVVNVTELQVTPAEAEILPGGEQEFIATAILSNGSKLNVSSNVIWASSDPAVANVSDKGSARGLSIGGSNISATLSIAGNSWTDSSLLSVAIPDVTIEQFRILPVVQFTLPNSSVSFRAELVCADGLVLDMSILADWSVADSSVAELINDRGDVRTLNPGASLVEASVRFLGVDYHASAELVVISRTLDITGLEVEPNPATLLAGGTRQLQAFLTLSNGDVIDVTDLGQWLAQDETIATVDHAGVLSGVSEGSTLITKTIHFMDGDSWSANLTADVADPVAQLAELRVTPTNANAISGSTTQFTATAVFTDGGSQDVTAAASWTIAQPEVADLTDQAGKILATAAGTTAITASYSVGGVTVSDIVSLTVAAPDLTITDVYLIPADQVTTLNGVVAYRAMADLSDGSSQDVTDDAVWLSIEPSIAQLTGTQGEFKALAVGATVISASIELAGEPYTATGNLEVSSKLPQWLEMAPWYSETQQGQKTRFNALMHYDDGTSADVTTQQSWTSEHPAIALVNNSSDKGSVTGLLSGETKINVADSSGLTAIADVNVFAATLLSITLEPVSASIPIGYTQAFRAIGTYTGGYQFDITNADEIYWFSDGPHIADVVSNGVVEGVLAGDAIITVGLSGVTATASVQVTNATPTALRIEAEQSTVLGRGLRDHTAIMTFSDGVELDVTQRASWRTGEQAQAQVYNRNPIGLPVGRVSGRAAGITSIQASLGGLTASSPLEILNGALDVTELTIFSGATDLSPGERTQYQVIGRLTDNRGINVSRDVVWESDNPSVLRINNGEWYGQAIAISAGQATVRATLHGVTAEIIVTVNP